MSTMLLTDRQAETETTLEARTSFLRELADDLGEALDLALLLHDLETALVEQIDGVFRRQLGRPLVGREALARVAA